MKGYCKKLIPDEQNTYYLCGMEDPNITLYNGLTLDANSHFSLRQKGYLTRCDDLLHSEYESLIDHIQKHGRLDLRLNRDDGSMVSVSIHRIEIGKSNFAGMDQIRAYFSAR